LKWEVIIAPPKLFINTKTLDVEKLEKDVVDGLNTESKNGINTSAAEREDVGKAGKEDVAGCSFFCLRFLSLSCIGLGMASIAAAVALICSWTSEWLPVSRYLLTLGLHIILIGCHLLFGPTFGWGCSGGALFVKIWSTSLAKWILENPKRGKVLIGSVLLVTEGIVFALLEFSLLFSTWSLEAPLELEYQWVGEEYAASYEMRVAGSVISMFLALPWPLFLLWPSQGCPVTFPHEGNPEKFTEMLQQKKERMKEMIVFLLPSIPAPLNTIVSPSPHQRPRQTAVALIMLFITAMFFTQLLDVGRFDDLTGIFWGGFIEELKDPEDTTYAREGMFLFLWLKPEDVRMMVTVAAPLTFLLCLPLFFLNRQLSFVNLGLVSLLLFPMGLFYAFLSVTSTTWLLLLSPEKVSRMSLILRILGIVFPLIITALIMALLLSYVESIAQRNATAEEAKKNKKTDVFHHWKENVMVFFTCVVVTCSFASVSINLMKSPSTHRNSTLHENESQGWVSSVEPCYLTFALAHLALSGNVMVMAVLVLLVGNKLTGLTSFFLGVSNTTASVFMLCQLYQGCGGCLREELEKLFGTISIVDLSIILGLFIGIFDIICGLEAFFKLAASLLKMLLVLPLLAGLTLIALTKSIIDVARLLLRKVHQENVHTRSDKEKV